MIISSKRNYHFFYIFFLVFILVQGTISAPEWFPSEKNSLLGGYLKDFPLITFPNETSDVFLDNVLHFRLNTNWYPWSFFRTELAGRMLLYSGKNISVNDTLGLQAIYDRDLGYLDLTGAWITVLTGAIDRAWVAFLKGDLTATLGRQRINWGTNFVWNPNDWFNAFNFLDFDYVERPGADAFKFTYYTGATSMFELALSYGEKQENRTFAALYKFNRFNYDIQTQLGINENDLAMGVSWSGGLWGSGFRGEAAYFYPFISNDFEFIGKDTSGELVSSLSWDYIFPNSFYVHLEGLYNGFGTGGEIDNTLLREQKLSATNLLPSRFALFAEIAYTFTPLLSGNFAVSTNPDDFSFYLAPSITWSVFQDIDFYGIAQVFFGDEMTLYGELSDLIALTLQWNF